MAEKVYMLALSPTMEAGTILKWNKKEGNTIAHHEVICEVETDKASMEYESMNEGILLKIVKGEGESATVGQSIAIVGKEGEDISAILSEVESEVGSTQTESNSTTVPPANMESNTTLSTEFSTRSSRGATDSTTTVNAGGRIVASPLARKLAAEKGIALESIQGTGPDGRIVKRDVEQANRVHGGQLGSSVGKASGGSAQDITIPVTGVRSVVAQRLFESKFSAPHFYVKNTVRIEKMMSLRAVANAAFPEKLSLNAFIIKFVAEAIKQHPEINASWQGANIVQFASVDISLAVDLGNGLFTPVVRNCGNKSIKEIDAELKMLVEKVRNKTIAPEEYSGATFTVSNLGSFGVDEFTAIINPPGAAILAVGRGKKVPLVAESGNIEVGNVMALTLSSDHRVIDGSLAGSFIAKLQAIIENPGVALL